MSIKYNKMNGITPMKIHVDFTHFYLVAKRKLKLIGKYMDKHFETSHTQYIKKKRVGLHCLGL
jgi:hypothetical protein